MKRKQLRSALALVSASALVLAGCGGSAIDTSGIDTSTPAETTETPADSGASEETPEQPTETVEAEGLTFAEGTVLRMSCGYSNEQTGMRFNAKILGEGVESITLADGNTYHAGDFKPTWVEVQNRLGFTIEDVYTNKGSSDNFNDWTEKFDQVDVLNGTATLMQEYGEAGSIVNIAEYLDLMPNFKAYLDANPIVRLSITGNVENGAIYFSPYFDGVDDIEKMPLMRTDWVQKLLDGEGEFTADASDKTAAPVYQPFMPTEGKVEVDVVKTDGSGTEKVTKDYDTAGNIVAKMNEAGSIDGVEAVNMLRTYIDEAYGGYYGTERSNLFVGQNAAWDADELVALLRCVTSNTATLNPNATGEEMEVNLGTKDEPNMVTVTLPDKVQGLFSRQDNNLSRRADLYRFAGTLFGVRGTESRQGFLYVGNDGELHDGRMDTAFYEALGRMNDMAEEGLISKAYVNNEQVKVENYLENDIGFMEYDYNQTQTVYNEDGKLDSAAGEKFMAAMVPVSRWDDGTGEVFKRFTESWRSVKTDGWGISKAGVGDDQDKLYAALKLIDYAYSPEGQILMSYGPDAFIKTDGSGNYVTFDFNGQQFPEIADATYAELWEKAGGNYTNYARYYIGSTLSFKKLQSFEYQCTTEAGKEGAGYLSRAIALGTIDHPQLAITDNKWYTSVPTTLPFTKQDNELIGTYENLGNNKFSTANKTEGVNVLNDIVATGFTGEGMTSAEGAATTVSDTWNGKQYLALANDAWDRLEAFYTAN